MSGVLPTTPFSITAFGPAQSIVSSGSIPVDVLSITVWNTGTAGVPGVIQIRDGSAGGTLRHEVPGVADANAIQHYTFPGGVHANGLRIEFTGSPTNQRMTGTMFKMG